MGKKICTICNGPLGVGNYCTTCKRRIKTPLIISSNMHLNESHPMVETDCEYHENPDPASSYEQMTGDQAKMKRKPLAFDSLSGKDIFTGKDVKAKTNLVKLGVIAGVVLYFVIMPIAKSAISSLKYASSHKVVEEIAPEEILPEEIKTEYLTLEEARNYGARCNALGHLPVFKNASAEYLRSWCKEQGFGNVEEMNSTYNMVDLYENIEYSYFLDVDYFNLGIAEESEQMYFVEISSDSVSGEFHSLSSVMETQEDAKKLMIDFGTYLESMLGLSPGESGLSRDIDNLEISDYGEILNTSYGYFSAGKVEDGYSIYINSIEEE